MRLMCTLASFPSCLPTIQYQITCSKQTRQWEALGTWLHHTEKKMLAKKLLLLFRLQRSKLHSQVHTQLCAMEEQESYPLPVCRTASNEKLAEGLETLNAKSDDCRSFGSILTWNGNPDQLAHRQGKGQGWVGEQDFRCHIFQLVLDLMQTPQSHRRSACRSVLVYHF